MQFDFNEEQQALQDSLRRYLDKQYGFEQRRATAASTAGHSEQAWATYAEMGLLALPLSADRGGMGGTAVETMLVMEQLGARLALEPYLATVVLGGGLLRDLGTAEQQDALMVPMSEGRLKLALAHQEPAHRYARHHVATRATRQGEGWSLSGSKAVVLGAPSADQLLVTARTSGDDAAPQGISLFIVERGALGVDLRSYRTQDDQRAADIRLNQVQLPDSQRLGPLDGAQPAIARVLDQAIAALCAEAVGVMDMLNAQTLDYIKTRKQFGVAIGSFQVLQHRMVDMVIAARQSRSMAILAAVKADASDASERSQAVSAAKAYIGEQSRFVGQQAVQLHGGMGLSNELIVSHAFKRLSCIEATLGDTDHHFGRFSESLRAA